MSAIEAFVKQNKGILDPLSLKGRDAYMEICNSVSHLRTRQAQDFFIELFHLLKKIDQNPLQNTLLQGAVRLSHQNWALVKPFFNSAETLGENRELMTGWIRLTLDLVQRDVDVAVTFLVQTPLAYQRLGTENLFKWGQQAVTALNADPKQMWRAAKAYLIESSSDQCAYSLDRWQAFLNQANRIASVSATAAEKFMQSGNQVCLMLDDAETEQWISTGLETCATEEQRINYFSGISLKALERRDDLVAGLALRDCSNTLALICEALLGKSVKIRPNTVLAGQKKFTGTAATDGRSIFLPEVVPEFGLFKLMALHQAMLVDRMFVTDTGRAPLDAVKVHLAADQRLLHRLPGLRIEMEKFLPDHHMGAYPEKLSASAHMPPPWWGDLLPELVADTTETIDRLTARAMEEYDELPPELVEAMLAGMMADGHRETDSLWTLFQEMLDNMLLISPDAEVLEENVKTFFYKEWDDNLSDYKLDWCLIRQRPAKADANAFVEQVCSRLDGIIKLIRRQFLRLKPERFRKYKAQPIGDGLDIDALVEAVVDMRSGAFLSENVYIRRDKRIRDVAVLFLVDMSSSTEEKIGGHRVIDIQKEAMVLMAEALDALEDPYAIYGFSSEGRFRVDLFGVKDFLEPYSDIVRYRLGNLEPLGLTRMGAVIRHACHKLESITATVKLMIILTDGRPYDLEYGVLDYAVADTKKAIQETRRKGIHPFIITSDKKGEDYLKRISPQTGSIILPKVELLPKLLPAIYKRLTV